MRWSALTRVPEDGTWGVQDADGAARGAGPGARPRTPSPPSSAATCERSGPPPPRTWRAGSAGASPPVRAALAELDLLALDGGLYDLPDAPRPDAGHPAPARFLAAFDSALLAYPSKRRTRLVPDELRDLVYLRKNLQVKPTFLVDGFVAGIWALEVKRREAILTLTGSPDDDVIAEGERLARWAHPNAKAHHVVTG